MVAAFQQRWETRYQSALEKGSDEFLALLLNARALAFAGASDIERLGAISFQPVENGFFRRRSDEIDDTVRLLVFFAKLLRQQRAAGEGAAAEDQCDVAVEHVFLGADGIVRRVGLLEPIYRGNLPILGQPALRAPPSVGNPQGQGRFQRPPIDTRLSTGNDPHKQKGLGIRNWGL